MKGKKILYSVSAVATAVIMTASLAGCGGSPKNLKEVYDDYFPIGVALGVGWYDYYSDDIYSNFSSITCENAMKWESIEYKEGTFTFGSADKLVNFAKERDMLVRGHAILWHAQAPSWIFYDENDELADVELLKSRITDYVEKTVAHFKGSVYVWDVANEVLSDDYSTLYRKDAVDEATGTPSPDKESKWRQCCKSDEEFEDLLAHAFKEVKRVDPDAKLFYNDYNLTIPAKMNNCLKMIENLRAKGAQIDGVGEQAHYTIPQYNGTLLEQAIERYAAAGLEFQLTELDVSVYSSNYYGSGYDAPTDAMLESQAQVYKDIFDICCRHSDVVTGVTLWGVADDNTWLDNWPVANRKNWPLLFDEFGEPKPCYKALLNHKIEK